jgi:pimeloyl-ACP methyl ester carboxylesterase
MLLHGFPETSWEWRPTVTELGARGYRAVAFDQRGYSHRARPEGVGAYAIPHLVADVLEVADALDIHSFDLVGHDWGGLLAWVLAAQHPERVRSLCAVSTPHPAAMVAVLADGDLDQLERSAYVPMFRQQGEPEEFLLGSDGSGAGLRLLFRGSGVDDRIIDEYVYALTEPGALTAALNWYRALDGSELGTLPTVTVPTMYVWSTCDVALGRKAAERTARFVKGAYRFEVLEGISHWIPEQANEELNRLLLEHLASA